MILSPPAERIVLDVEFHFNSGRFLGVVVDHKMGDEYWETEAAYEVKLGPRPSINGSDPLPAEQLSIQRASVAYVVRRERTHTEATDEQKEELNRLIVEGSKLTH